MSFTDDAKKLGEILLKPGAAEAVCPCGRPFVAGFLDTPEETPAVLHASPPCAKFLDLEPVDFLAWVNATRAEKLRKSLN